MERDPLNYFQPFENLPPGHENQLTRALLLVLRLSPIAHGAWLRCVAPGRQLFELPEAEFATQKREIKIEADPDDPAPLVSVFLTPTLASGFDDAKVVAESDRTQVLDAIISYPGELVVVVENKITPADDWQAMNLNITGVAVQIADGQATVRVLWPELLADFNRILERKLVAGAEYAVLYDFLVYVEDHFPGLGPDQTLGLCGGDPYRLERRLRSVLAEATDTEARIDKWGPCTDLPELAGIGQRLYLRADSDTVALTFYPADTITQAREFYTHPHAVQAARRLGETEGWDARHNFHFGHMQAGYAWTTGDIRIDDYLKLWTEKITTAAAVRAADWATYFAWLVEAHIATPDDRPEFDKHFTNTNRRSATPRPGIEVGRFWSLDDAVELDSADKFAIEVAAAYEQIQAAFE